MDVQLLQMVVVAAGTLTTGAIVAGLWMWTRKVNAAWGQVAEQLGVELRKKALGAREIVGPVGGYPLVVDTITRGGGNNTQIYTRFTLDGQGAFHLGLKLKAESTWEGLKKVFGGEDVQLDEAQFDSAVNVKGPEDVLLAALDPEARRAVLQLVAQRCEVRDGKIFFETGGILRDPPKMVALARTMVAAADALRVPSVVEALQRNARTDPNPGVRRRNLEALVKHQLHRPETREALERALEDPSPEVRLHAAGVLRSGPKVLAVLERLFDEARELTDPQRAQVLTLLVECFPHGSVAGRVARALDLPSLPLQVVAVTAAGRARDTAPLLARPDLARTTDASLGVALATALGEAGGAAGEAMLLDLLKGEVRPVQVAAAKALGRAGTVRSVEPLLPFTQGLFADGALKDAAREAVRGIQSRLGEVQAGGLSVVDDRVGGGLSAPPLSSDVKDRGG